MLCKYLNYSWFPSRKHTQVLRFFQSHDHTVYSKRGPLWADLVWKSALLHECDILEDLHERLVPEVERGQVGDMWSHMWHSTIPVQSQTGLTPIREWCPFSLPLTPLSSASLRTFFSTWRWKVFDQMSLLDAMAAACQDITTEHCQGWLRHTL